MQVSKLLPTRTSWQFASCILSCTILGLLAWGFRIPDVSVIGIPPVSCTCQCWIGHVCQSYPTVFAVYIPSAHVRFRRKGPASFVDIQHIDRVLDGIPTTWSGRIGGFGRIPLVNDVHHVH